MCSSSIQVTHVSYGARGNTPLPLGVNNDGTARGNREARLRVHDGSRNVLYGPPGRRRAEQARDLELGRDGGEQGSEPAGTAVSFSGCIDGGGRGRDKVLGRARGVAFCDALRLLGGGHVGLLGKGVGRVGTPARVGGQAEAGRGRRLWGLAVAASSGKVVVSAELVRRRAAPVLLIALIALGIDRRRRGNGALRALHIVLPGGGAAQLDAATVGGELAARVLGGRDGRRLLAVAAVAARVRLVAAVRPHHVRLGTYGVGGGVAIRASLRLVRIVWVGPAAVAALAAAVRDEQADGKHTYQYDADRDARNGGSGQLTGGRVRVGDALRVDDVDGGFGKDGGAQAQHVAIVGRLTTAGFKSSDD